MDELIKEQDVAERTGISRAALKKAREQLLERETDWKREHRFIFYTVEGYEKLKEIFRKPPASESKEEPPASVEEKRANPCEDGSGIPLLALSGFQAANRPRVHVETLVVSRIYKKNPRFLEATIKDDSGGSAGVQRVKVSNNVNFMPGMELNALRTRSGVWALIGRCPRRKGKW